jgi:hypothetical protein
MYVELHETTVTTAADGSATAYLPADPTQVLSGRILAIAYEKTDFAAGVDFDVTTERSGQVVWSEDDVDASKIVYPRAQVHTTAGVAATLDGTRPALEPIVAGQERLKIEVASGGNAKSGKFKVLVG